MRLFLGLDGGGTGCRAALADAGGRVLAQCEGGPANIASDPATALANILTVTQDMLARAGEEAAAPDLHVVMGLAGANVAASAAQLRAGLPFRSLRIESDAVIAVKGALRDADGIVAAIGTGSVFARQHGGVLRQIGGRGLILGDEGSGGWLGRALLSASLRAADGFAPVTPLLRSVLDDLGGENGVITFSLTATPADFARLARHVVGSSDPAAATLIAQAEADIRASIVVLQTEPALPVTFLGGLGESFAPRFADLWDMRPALGNALDGALWLALQDGHAT